MKINITFLSLLAVSTAFVASAQVVEYDDMYFNSKDRVTVQSSKQLTLKNISSEQEIATAINPTDSYSARNVNPEYISQSTVNPSGSVKEAPYFIPDYTPTNINQNLNSNYSSNLNTNNYAMAGYNPYFGMMPGFGNSFGSYYPSMYGYDPYGYNSFYRPNSSFWSMSMGFGMSSYSPWGSYGGAWGGSPFWNNYYGMNYYNSWGMNSYYPNVVIINHGDYNNQGVVYGKRASRSSDLNNAVNLNTRNTTMVTTDSQGRVRGSNGRVSSDGNTNSNSYYKSGWRSNPEINSTRSTWSNSGRSSFNDSGTSNRSTSTGSRSYFDNSSRSLNMGSNSSNFSSGSGSRSSSGSGGGGASSGARRGRD